MKNTIIKNLITTGTLAILLVSTHSASAYVPGVWEPQPRVASNEAAFTKVPTTYDAPVTPQTTPATVKTSTTTTPAKTVSTTTTKKTTVATTTQPKQVASSQVYTNTAYPANVYQSDNNYPYQNYNNGSELTALSLQGSGGFMPSSVWQWLIVIFLILVIIIIARILGRRQEHHEVHTVTHH